MSTHRDLACRLLAGVALLASGLAIGGLEAQPPPTPAEGEAPLTLPDAHRFEYTAPPRLLNAEEVLAALAERYPVDLEERGVEGRVRVWMWLNADGRVARTRMGEGSGERRLDEAALEVAEMMRFAPALHGGRPTATRVLQGFTFPPSDAAPAGPEEPPLSRAAERPDRQDAPDAACSAAGCGDPFRPLRYDRSPELLNGPTVARHMDRVYREELRARGVGGRVGLSLLVDTAGVVGAACVFGTSGYEEIDDLALALTRVMQFEPARAGGESVPAWTAHYLTFSFGILAPPEGLPPPDRTVPLPPCPGPSDYEELRSLVPGGVARGPSPFRVDRVTGRMRALGARHGLTRERSP